MKRVPHPCPCVVRRDRVGILTLDLMDIVMRKCLLARGLMFCVLLIAGLVAPGKNCFAQLRDVPKSEQGEALKVFLQNYVRDPHYDYKATRYLAAFVDLRDDGTHQAIVHFTDRYSCGSGACNTLILEPEGSSYRVVTSITITRLPIGVLATKSNGWHDISVWVAGGGIQSGYEAELSFDGRSYPSNPSLPPVHRLGGKVQGKIVMPETAKDEPLYP